MKRLHANLVAAACGAITAVAISAACSPAQLKDAASQADAASDAKTYACRYIEMLDSAEPSIQQAQSLCKSGAELQLVLAAAAGAEACEQVSR